MSVESLYSEVILYHNQSRHNKRSITAMTHSERGHNPNCGDDLTLLLSIDDGVIVDAAYSGTGCAISQASTSIMIDLIKGSTVETAEQKMALYFKLLRGEKLDNAEVDVLEDAALFESLGKMPARIKCGTLGWHCLEVCLRSE